MSGIDFLGVHEVLAEAFYVVARDFFGGCGIEDGISNIVYFGWNMYFWIDEYLIWLKYTCKASYTMGLPNVLKICTYFIKFANFVFIAV